MASTRSSFSSASGASSSLSQPKLLGLLSTKRKNALFSLLVTLVKESEHNVLATLTLFAETMQLYNFGFEHFKWGESPGSTWIFITGLFQIENLLIRKIGQLGLIVLISIILGVTALMVGLAYYVFQSFTRGSFRAGIGPVRFLRFMVSLLLTVGFIPMFVILLSIFNCNYAAKHYANYGSCAEPLTLVYIALAGVGILVLVPFTLVATITYFEPNPRSKSWFARPNPRLEILELFAKLALAVTHIFAADYPVIRALVFLGFSIVLVTYVAVFLPYYHRKMNLIKMTLCAELVWAAICSVIVAVYDDDSVGHVILLVHWAGVAVVATGSFFLFKARWALARNIFLPKLTRMTSTKKLSDMEDGTPGVTDAEAEYISGMNFRWPWLVENYTRSVHDSSTDEEIRRAELIFRRGLELYPQHPYLLVAAALFFATYKKDSAMAIMLCQRIVKAAPPLDVEFTVFYLRRGGIFDNSTGARLDMVDQLDFKHLQKKARSYHDEAKKRIGLFWKQLLLDHAPAVQVRLLNEYASQINKAERRAAAAYEQLCHRFPPGKHW
ncbi:hypothetical protein BC832DRAFT_437928 [Gaertneriomyces semiglobifer]|nr:hypothetical protein BC832DRAFT_437928 [Gaertneriomyces semiglobifer]